MLLCTGGCLFWHLVFCALYVSVWARAEVEDYVTAWTNHMPASLQRPERSYCFSRIKQGVSTHMLYFVCVCIFLSGFKFSHSLKAFLMTWPSQQFADVFPHYTIGVKRFPDTACSLLLHIHICTVFKSRLPSVYVLATGIDSIAQKNQWSLPELEFTFHFLTFFLHPRSAKSGPCSRQGWYLFLSNSRFSLSSAATLSKEFFLQHQSCLPAPFLRSTFIFS